MKFKTTQKAIKANYNKIICIPYCGLQHLLAYENPVAYTVRREGRAADIYDMGGGVAIATGNAPFGNIKPSFGIVHTFDYKAENIRYNYSLSWEERREQIRKLQRDFIREVVGNE